jgi:hypothetical protein
MGVTLNPTFFGEDMKFFWLRPSMMGWIMLNIGWAAAQVELHGSMTHAMLLTQLFNLAYTPLHRCVFVTPGAFPFPAFFVTLHTVTSLTTSTSKRA